MCGRVNQSSKTSVYASMFDAVPVPGVKPRYNLNPTEEITICRMNGMRKLLRVRWGLIPHWSKEPKTKYSTHNAVSESVATSNAYRDAFKRNQRCLIPVDGFYEWKGDKSPKQPYYIHHGDNQPFALAGFWDHWEGKWEGKHMILDSCTILTTEPNKLVGTIYNRMPVVIDANDYERWLNPGLSSKDMISLFQTRDYEGFEAYPISKRINNPKIDEASLTERIIVS